MRIAFFGTPDFAVPCLEALIRARPGEVVVAVTQPDKPKGRGQETSPTPVKEVALRAGIEVLQPASVKTPPFAPILAARNVDLAVVVAYGKILPADLLKTPRMGCINVHGSILPRWRGAAPIQWAVLEGDEVSGVTSMQLDEGMDTGDILLTRELRLAADETAGSLFERLAPLGAELLLETITGLEQHTLTPRKQDATLATHARMLEKEDGRVDWNRASIAVDRHVRGMSPWPGAFTTFGEKAEILKIHRVRKTSDVPGSRPGAIHRSAKSHEVECASGRIELVSVQPAGGKPMSGDEFLRGRGAKLEILGRAA